MRLLLLCFVTFGVLPTYAARAWDDGGHMLVAQIAYEQLTPQARRQADALVAQLKNPAAPAQKYSFVTAACWMDDVRRVEGYERMKSWHFIDRDCEGHDPQPPHAISALSECEALLREPRTAEAKRVEALACVLHLVGDVHQPLHAIDRERGGNTYPITGVPELWLGIAENGEEVTDTNPAKYQRLHAYWDSAYRYDVPPESRQIALLYYTGRSMQPNLRRVQLEATALQRFMPNDKSLLSETDASKWVSESNALACSFAFETPRKEQPSLQYVRRAHDEACRRLLFAGYRLSTLLNHILVPAPDIVAPAG